ncbi:hypothetical protein CSUI_007222, partial [Cystoisospora suis]
FSWGRDGHGQETDYNAVDRDLKADKEGWDRYPEVKNLVQEQLKHLRFDAALSTIAASYGPWSSYRVSSPRNDSPSLRSCLPSSPSFFSDSLPAPSRPYSPASFAAASSRSESPTVPPFSQLLRPFRVRGSLGCFGPLDLNDGSLRSCASLSERKKQAAAQLFNRLLETCAFRATLPIVTKAFVNSLPVDILHDAVRELRRSFKGSQEEEKPLRSSMHFPGILSPQFPPEEGGKEVGDCLHSKELAGREKQGGGECWRERTARADTVEGSETRNVLKNPEKRGQDEEETAVNLGDLFYKGTLCRLPPEMLSQSSLPGPQRKPRSLVRSLFEALDYFSRVLDVDRWVTSSTYSCLVALWRSRRENKDEGIGTESTRAEVEDTEKEGGGGRSLQRNRKQCRESERETIQTSQGGRTDKVDGREHGRYGQLHRAGVRDKDEYVADAPCGRDAVPASPKETFATGTRKDTSAERLEKRELTTLLLGYLMRTPDTSSSSGSPCVLPSCSDDGQGGIDTVPDAIQQMTTGLPKEKGVNEKGRSKEAKRERKDARLDSRPLFVDAAEERIPSAFRMELKRRRLQRCLELLCQASCGEALARLDTEETGKNRRASVPKNLTAEAHKKQRDNTRDSGEAEEYEKVMLKKEAVIEETKDSPFSLGFSGDTRTHIIILGAAVALGDEEGNRIAREQLLLIDKKTRFLRFPPTSHREKAKKEEDRVDETSDLEWIQILQPQFIRLLRERRLLLLKKPSVLHVVPSCDTASSDSTEFINGGDRLPEDSISFCHAASGNREERRRGETEAGRQPTPQEDAESAEKTRHNGRSSSVNQKKPDEEQREMADKELSARNEQALTGKEENGQRQQTGGKGEEAAKVCSASQPEDSSRTDMEREKDEESGRDIEEQSRREDEKDEIDSERLPATSHIPRVLADAFLVAVKEAEACARDKHRHGASLFRVGKLGQKAEQADRSGSCSPCMLTCTDGVLCGGRNFVLQPEKTNRRERQKGVHTGAPKMQTETKEDVERTRLKSKEREQAMTAFKHACGFHATEPYSHLGSDEPDTGCDKAQEAAFFPQKMDIHSTGQTRPEKDTAKAEKMNETEKSKGAARRSSSVVIHAEVDCLAKVPTDASKGCYVCIVELDAYGIGYESAHPCPMCLQSLQHRGVTGAFYSTPLGLRAAAIAPKQESEKRLDPPPPLILAAQAATRKSKRLACMRTE